MLSHSDHGSSNRSFKTSFAKTGLGRRRTMSHTAAFARFGRHRYAAAPASAHPADDTHIGGFEWIDAHHLLTDRARRHSGGNRFNILRCKHRKPPVSSQAIRPEFGAIVANRRNTSFRPKVG